MVRTIVPGDPGGGGPPPPGDQARAARTERSRTTRAAKTALLKDANGEITVEGEIQITGDGVTLAWNDEEERVEIATGQILYGAAAARPASPSRPSIYIATDTGAHSSWDGTSWRTI